MYGFLDTKYVWMWYGLYITCVKCKWWCVCLLIVWIAYKGWHFISKQLLSLMYLSNSNLSWGHYEGLWTARGPGPGPPEWYGPKLRFLLLLVHWTAAQPKRDESQSVALTCMWKLTAIRVFYWLIIHNSLLFVQSFRSGHHNVYGPVYGPV